MRKQIFISRALQEDSVLWQLQAEEDVEIQAQSLVEFTAIDFEMPEHIDWLFFYSKTGVDFFFKNIFEKGVRFFNFPKIAAIGSGTAQQLGKYNHKSDFVGTGLANTTVPIFEQIAQNQTVAFVQAKNSGQSIQKNLSNRINKLDLIVYDNQEITNIRFENHNILVFTSPKNIKAYFNALKNKEKALESIDFVAVIGYISENELKNYYQGPYLVAETPDELALKAAIKKGIKKYAKNL